MGAVLEFAGDQRRTPERAEQRGHPDQCGAEQLEQTDQRPGVDADARAGLRRRSSAVRPGRSCDRDRPDAAGSRSEQSRDHQQGEAASAAWARNWRKAEPDHDNLTSFADSAAGGLPLRRM